MNEFIKALEQRIFKVAGEDFAILDPMQTYVILREKLGVPVDSGNTSDLMHSMDNMLVRLIVLYRDIA